MTNYYIWITSADPSVDNIESAVLMHFLFLEDFQIVVSTGTGEYALGYDYDYDDVPANVVFVGTRTEVEEYLLSQVDDYNFAWCDLHEKGFFVLEDVASGYADAIAPEFVPVERIRSFSHTLYKLF